jgi:hypothetical protein
VAYLQNPSYNLDDFIDACRIAEKVYFMPGVLDGARDFDLLTKEDVFIFLSDFKKLQYEFVNTKDWENNPNPAVPRKVDGYEFFSKCKRGYLAFILFRERGTWLVKSLHISDNTFSDFTYAFGKGKLPGGKR